MRKMPHSRIWQQILAKQYDDQTSISLILRAQNYYKDYYIQHTGITNRANRAVLKTRILPGLAIYKALLDGSGDQHKALTEVDTLFRAAFFTKRMQVIRMLNYLPDPFPIVILALKRMSMDTYLRGSQEIVVDSADCFAVNVYRCFILDTLVQHDARALTAIFCNTDDWLAELMPKIRWERSMTLGRGGDRCDFRWSRGKG